jgi:hypothetical protein
VSGAHPASGAALVLAALALTAAGCGASGARGPLHVVSLSLTAANGFPGPPSTHVTVASGPVLRRLARLVPLPLPPMPDRRAAGSHPLTVCFPMDLRVVLSNGTSAVYPSCRRPRALRALVGSLCRLLGRPGLCVAYRDELATPGGGRSPETGSRSVKVEPSPTVERTASAPSWASAIARAM